MRERPWRRFDGYALVLVFSGHGTYRDVRGRDEPVGGGDAILVTPGFEHWYGPPDGQRWGELFVVFEGPLFDLLAGAGVLGPERPLLRGRGAAEWVERTTALVGAATPSSPEAALSELWSFGALLLDLLGPAAPVPERDPIGTAQRLLASDLDASLDLVDVARSVGLGYERFRHRFSAEAGSSPARYRDQRRIEAARELLRHTELPHRQIAAILGFADEFHFSKRFRALVGCSPRAFREDARREGG